MTENSSKEPGFDPLAWQRVGQYVFVPSSELLCKLVCVWPSFVCTARTQICSHVKSHVSICCKRVGIRAGGTETRKHCTIQGGGGGGGGGSWV